MEIKHTTFWRFGSLLAGLLFFMVVSYSSAYAASGTITVSPENGTFTTGQVTTLSVLLNGGGSAFNAAKATVTTSPSVSIQNVTFGNCGFAFVKTPTQADASFAGAILGGSSTSCTLYTVNVKWVSAGTGTITFSDASLLSSKGAVSLLGNVNNGSYSITGASIESSGSPSPTQAPLVSNTGVPLYDIHYTYTYPNGIKKNSLSFQLDPETALVQSSSLSSTDTTAGATFTNVAQGIHTIVVLKDGASISKQIVNIGGKNKDIFIGAIFQQASLISYWWVLLIIIIVLAVVITYVYKHRSIKKTTGRKVTRKGTRHTT